MPDSWGDRIFRASFLLYLDHSGHRETVEAFGSLLAALVREHAHYWPTPEESWTVRDLRAAADDLRHTEAHLRWIAEAGRDGSLPPEELRLCERAAGLAEEVGSLAARVELCRRQRVESPNPPIGEGAGAPPRPPRVFLLWAG